MSMFTEALRLRIQLEVLEVLDSVEIEKDDKIEEKMQIAEQAAQSVTDWLAQREVEVLLDVIEKRVSATNPTLSSAFVQLRTALGLSSP